MPDKNKTSASESSYTVNTKIPNKVKSLKFNIESHCMLLTESQSETRQTQAYDAKPNEIQAIFYPTMKKCDGKYFLFVFPK